MHFIFQDKGEKMLPARPQDYPTGYPVPIWYAHLLERFGEDSLEKLGFYPNERLLDIAKKLSS